MDEKGKRLFDSYILMKSDIKACYSSKAIMFLNKHIIVFEFAKTVMVDRSD
ncbi:hypothetical protein N781_01805 [Pontibacillus halophilus JSM 076056 = DSM 19796]|uniref:Uncharacterized protein n=1 Tax=Pontibacillus halophilus JSM 076056 = DSM 19796 TaxID=1385510 RepID=A0A0A5GSH3_9BACI|nr:hypothetical protein N781_01805 [Pontibacillus halophilus JSM 076056 = DSM 19796]